MVRLGMKLIFTYIYDSIGLSISSINFEIKHYSDETHETSLIALPHKSKMKYVHFRLHANYFLLPWKIPEEISAQTTNALIPKGCSYVPYQT